MEEAPQQENLQAEIVQPRDEGNANAATVEGERGGDVPQGDATSSKKDWKGYKIPKKRKNMTVKGTSKRRKHHSKDDPDSDLADDGEM